MRPWPWTRSSGSVPGARFSPAMASETISEPQTSPPTAASRAIR
ncbi:hypothetical protein [Streptomyces tirandamycinicus]|nr:hypothetical protein [Streptomyces tirandamycinicus]